MNAQGRQVVTFPGGGTLPFSLGVKADGLIYVAGTLAQEGDIKAQTKSVLDSMGQTLTKSGSSLANVVSAHVYLKNGADCRRHDRGLAHGVAQGRAVPTPPCRRSWSRPPRWSRFRSSRSRTAASGSSSSRPAGPPPTPTATPFDPATRCSCPGSSRATPKTTPPVEGDAATQTKAVMATAGELLKAAGFGFEHVVSSRVYITDNADFQAMNQDYTDRASPRIRRRAPRS